MNTYQDLLYCRQFMFCKKTISDFSEWKTYYIGEYKLYVHPKLSVSSVENKDKGLYLLGSLYDYARNTITNEEILDRLIRASTFEELLKASDRYTGRFILIFKHNSSIKIFHDPSAARKIHYYMSGDDFCCATQPHVIAKYFNIDKTFNQEIRQFYNSPQFYAHNKVGILSNTIYDPIKLLLPNRYIDVNRKEVIHFWPYRKLNTISLNEGVDCVTSILKGYLLNIHHRNKLMMAVTSGNDSRLLLAASRNICEDILYYVYHLPRMKSQDHPDLRIHRRIMKGLGLKEYIVEYETSVDENFKEIYYKNNEFPEWKNLPIIYNFLYKQCSDKLNVATTMSDVTRNFFSTNRKLITSNLLATIWQYKDMPYVISNYENWLTAVEPLAKKYGYNILDLFNWEERVGCWSSYYVSDSDIARDEVSPLNSRELLEIMLSVPKKYRDMHTNIFHRTMIKHMWPELAKFPYNPNFQKRTSYTLKKMGIYWPVRSIIRGW
jgi:hypothetical protein